MSENEKLPVQLTLSFDEDEANLYSAKIFFLNSHREARGQELTSESISKDAEERIIKRVLQRAEELSWYK